MLQPYREKLLAPGESTALITRPHSFTFWAQAVGGALLAILLFAAAVAIEARPILPASIVPYRGYITALLLGLALVGVVTVLWAWVNHRAQEIVVTDRRVLRISGVLSKQVIDNGLDAITDLQLRQSWLGRIFDYGDVDILTASETSAGLRDTFPVVAGPIRFMHAVQEQRERRRVRPYAQSQGEASAR